MITIKVQPQEAQSAYNEVIVVLDSTNKDEEKFQYVVDISVNGDFTSRLKIQSNPQGYGVVNISKHLEGFISSNLDLPNKEIFKKITDSYALYDVSIKEEYLLTSTYTAIQDNAGRTEILTSESASYSVGDFITVSGSSVSSYNGAQEITSKTSTSITTTRLYTSAVSSNGTFTISNEVAIVDNSSEVVFNDKIALNNVVNWNKVPDWSLTDYTLDTTNKGKLFTNLPTTFSTGLEDRFTVNFYNIVDNDAKYLKIVSNLGTFYVDNDYAVSSGDPDRLILSAGVGAFDIINTTLSVTLPSNPQPVIDLTTKSYTVALVNASLVETSETLTFNIDRYCKKYDGFRLMYLNRGGSFSTFNFTLAHTKAVNVKRKTFEQNYGSYDSNANTYGWNTYDRGTTIIDTEVDESFTINSDYVSETVGDTIADLIQSPEVYHLADNDYNTLGANVTISNATDNAGFLQIETGTAHGLSLADTVRFSGFASDSFNQDWTVKSIDSATKITINKTSTPLPFVGGGQVLNKVSLTKDGELRAINIKTTSVNLKQTKKEKLISYSIKFNYSTKNNTQR
tara:strand:- start:567 stop:2267 length:1701 start_codon:yes stop_codon:yes gene_type:complete